MKYELKKWNKERVDNLFTRAELLEEKIAMFQEKEMRSGMSLEELNCLRGYLADCHSILRMHETLWKQKSRVQWLLGGC